MKLVLAIVILCSVAVAVYGQSTNPLVWSGQWSNIGGPYSVGGTFNVCLGNNIPDQQNIYAAYGFFGTFGVCSGKVNSSSGEFWGSFQVAGFPTATYPTTGVFYLSNSLTTQLNSDQTPSPGFSGWYSFNTDPTTQKSWTGLLGLNATAMSGGLQDCLVPNQPQAIANTVNGVYNEVAADANNPHFDLCVSTAPDGSRIFEASYSGNGGGYMYGQTQVADHALYGNWADGTGQGYLLGRVLSETNFVIYRTPSLEAQNNNLQTSVSRNASLQALTANCHRNFNRINQLIPNPPPIGFINSSGNLLPSLLAIAITVVLAAFL